MYRIINFGSKDYAVKLMTSGRDAEDEFDEMQTFFDEDGQVEIRIVNTLEDVEEMGAELVIRDYE